MGHVRGAHNLRCRLETSPASREFEEASQAAGDSATDAQRSFHLLLSSCGSRAQERFLSAFYFGDYLLQVDL